MPRERLQAAAPEWEWVPKASAIAREAGARLREFFSQGVATEYKGDVDIVRWPTARRRS